MSDFQLTSEQIQEIGLSEEQAAKILEVGKETFSSYQKSIDDKIKLEGNQYAEGILSGAAKLVEDKTGISREQGEKLADYLQRTSSTHLETRQKEIDALKADYQKKIEGVKDGAELQKQLEAYQKKVAELEPLKDIATKFDEVNTKYSALKINTAFSKAMPKIPEGVNEFEKKARLDEVTKEILSKFDIDFDDKGEAIARDKENAFSIKPLKDLLSTNESIKAMIESAGGDGANKKGFGGNPPANGKKIDGVPFEVNDKMTSEDRSKAINEHLDKEGVQKLSSERAKRFAELNKKILEGLRK